MVMSSLSGCKDRKVGYTWVRAAMPRMVTLSGLYGNATFGWVPNPGRVSNPLVANPVRDLSHTPYKPEPSF